MNKSSTKIKKSVEILIFYFCKNWKNIYYDCIIINVYMWDVVQIDTSVNQWRSVAEWESAIILWWAVFFQKPSLNILRIWSEVDRVTDETKEQFEKKHFLEIQESQYDVVIEKLIQSIYYQSTMYITYIYEWVESNYMNALFKQKLNWYREKLLLILQEDFLKYEYSIHRFSDFYNQEIQKQFARKYLSWKK